MNIPGVLVLIGVVIFSMVLHEMAHAYTAYALGDRTAKENGRLSLNPLKHLDPVMSVLVPVVLYLTSGVVFGGAKPVPINTRNLKGGALGMALVGLAGPLTNLILALVAFLIGCATGALQVTGGNILYSDSLGSLIAVQMVMANLGFFIFNLLPIPPLDGSRVLYFLAPDFIREFMEKMERTVGLIIVMILVVFLGSYLSQFMSGVIQEILKFFVWLVA